MREEKFGSAVIRRRNCNNGGAIRAIFNYWIPTYDGQPTLNTREMKDQSQRLQFLYRSVSMTQKFWWNRGRGGGQRKPGVSLPSAQKTQHNAEKTGDCFIVGNSQNCGHCWCSVINTQGARADADWERVIPAVWTHIARSERR